MKNKIFRKILLFTGLIGTLGMAWSIIRLSELEMAATKYYIGLNILAMLCLCYDSDNKN